MLKTHANARRAKFAQSTGIVALLTALAACTPTAEVTYSRERKSDVSIAYQLATSTVAIGISATIDGSSLGGVSFETIDLSQRTIELKGGRWMDGDNPVALVAFVGPSASPNHLVWIEPTESIWKDVAVAASYRPNTLLLKELAIDTKDNRKEVIETVGAVAVGLVKVAAGMPFSATLDGEKPPAPQTNAERGAVLQLPIILSLEDLMRQRSQGGATIGFQQGPETKNLTFENELARTGKRRALLTSECRQGTLTLTPTGGAPIPFGITYADPRKVMTLPLPTKGKIELGSLCGGNVVIEQATKSTGKEIADTLFAQIEQLRKAVNPSN